MPGIQGQPTPKPQDLSSPVPETGDDFAALEAFAGSDDLSALDAFAVDPAVPAAAPAVNQQVPAPEEIDPNAMSPMPQPEGLASAREQINEAATRFKNAFTVTDNESLQVLKQSGLFDDVRTTADGLQVKRRGRKGWEKFDRDKVELIGDTLDLARDAFEGVIENIGRIGGAVGGFMASAPSGAAAGIPAGAPGMAAGAVSTGMAGAVPAAIAGGAVGAIAAKNAGDWLANKLRTDKDGNPIPQDPERNMTKENAVAAGMGAGISWLGSKMARRAAAREAAAGEARKTVEYAKQRLADAQADIADLQKAGVQLGDNFKLDPHQVVGQGNIPELDATARDLSQNESFRNFRRQVADSVTGAYDSVARTLGAQAGRGSMVGDDFVLSAQNVREVEGRMIGEFKNQAEQQLKGVSQLAPRTTNTIQMIHSQIKTPGHAERQLALTPAQAKNYMHEVDVMKKLLIRTQGNMRLDTAFALQDRLTKSINANINSVNGRPYAIALMDLRNSVRDDALDMMEQSFAQMGDPGNTLLKRFQSSKARYREIMEATGGLGKMLETDNISRNEVIGKLFEGKGSYKQAMNAKTLINETNPKLWDQLAGEYFVKLRNDATAPDTGVVNWSQMAKKWQNLDGRLQGELLNSTGLKPDQFNALMRLGLRVQNADFTAVARDSHTKSVIKGIFTMIPGLGAGATAKGNTIGSLVEGMGKNQSLPLWLKDGGLEEILREMPGLKADKKHALREWMDNWAPQTRPNLDANARGAVKGAARTVIRRRAEDDGEITP